jgi:hypothetical protein
MDSGIEPDEYNEWPKAFHYQEEAEKNAKILQEFFVNRGIKTQIERENEADFEEQITYDRSKTVEDGDEENSIAELVTRGICADDIIEIEEIGKPQADAVNVNVAGENFYDHREDQGDDVHAQEQSAISPTMTFLLVHLPDDRFTVRKPDANYKFCESSLADAITEISNRRQKAEDYYEVIVNYVDERQGVKI